MMLVGTLACSEDSGPTPAPTESATATMAPLPAELPSPTPIGTSPITADIPILNTPDPKPAPAPWIETITETATDAGTPSTFPTEGAGATFLPARKDSLSPITTEPTFQCAQPWLSPKTPKGGILPNPNNTKVPQMHPEMLTDKFVSTMFAASLPRGFYMGIYESYQTPGSMFDHSAYFIPMLQEDYGVTIDQLDRRQLRQLAMLGFNVADVGCSSHLKYMDTALKYKMQLQCTDHVGGMYLDPGKFGPINVEASKQVMQVWIDGYLTPNKDQLGLLAWSVYDEPGTTQESGIPGFLKDILVPSFYKTDPLHPVTLVSATALIASLVELFYSEVYELYGAAIKGNEDYSESVANIRATAETAKYINAYTLWTIDTGAYNVQPADIHKMTYLTLANGGNGLMWFSGSLQPPQWLRWPMEEGLNYNSMQGKQHGMFFDVVSEELTTIGELNQRLMPLGHLLVGATWLAEHPFQVESCPYQYLGSYSPAGIKYAQKESSSVELGAWDTGTAFVLVVYNSSIKSTEAATLHWTGLPESYHLYDLETLQDLGSLDSIGSFTLELGAGDGHFFMVAEPDVYATEKKLIEARRYLFLSQRLNARLEELQYTPVDLLSVKTLMKKAQAAYGIKSYAQAVTYLQQAEEVLQIKVSSHPVMGPITQSLHQARNLLGQINEWFRAKLPIIAKPLKPGEPLGGNMQQLGNGHPELQKIIDGQLRPASKKYYPLVLGLEQPGAPTAKPADFAAWVTELQSTYTALLTWIPGGGTSSASPLKVAVITLSEEDTANPTWIFAQQNIPGAERLVLTGPGQFKKPGALKATKLSTYDVLWFHYVNSIGNGFLDFEKRVVAPEALLAPETETQLRQFAQTKGLLLSGYATYLVHRWGLEPTAPNVLDQGTTGVMVPLFSGGQLTNEQNLGVRVAPPFQTHPIFKELDKDAIWLRGEAVYRQRHRFSWKYDPQHPETSSPKNGFILGGATYAILPPPDVHYDLVEYPNPNGGKILLVGLPYFDFDPQMNVGSAHADEYATLLHWMQNIVTYLGTLGTGIGKEQAPGISQPVYHVDFAKIEENPLITWKIDGHASTSPKPAFDKNLESPWERWFENDKKGPMTLEIDLGQAAIITQVAIFNSWVSNKWAGVIGKMKLQIKDDTGQCVDPPGGPFQFYGNGTEGLTFYLPPVQTTGVCFVDMVSAELAGSPKQPSSIGANDVRIYGAYPVEF